MAYAKTGNDVKDLARQHWGVNADEYADIGFDATLDLRYGQRVLSSGLWFVGIRSTGFGFIKGELSNEKNSSHGNQYDEPSPEFRALRIDMYIGPYAGIGLVF